MKLRDQLLEALGGLPGTRNFHIHVLQSSPRKHTGLFPYATARPRVYAQDILVLCSEQGTGLGAPRVFVSAIEAALYHIPSSASAILYIAKVDSTGQGARPAPTASLVRAFISHFVDQRTRPPRLAGVCMWVHLFARAQLQYLFPNSADHPAKRPLGDISLCAWWKRLLGHVARDLHAQTSGALPNLHYVLPGLNELEALQALGGAGVPAAEGSQWVYGHPYSQADVPLPYTPKTRDARPNLGQLIPSFDDDPKSRFMDEIACTTRVDGLVSPKRKRRKTSGADEEKAEGEEKKERGRGKERDTRVHGELGVVNADEFWERMSFRQECVAGAVTGFFVAVFPLQPSQQEADTSVNPLAPQPGEVSHQIVQRVVTSLMTGHDFSSTERTTKATEILEGAIRGLCGGVHTSSAARELPPFLAGVDDDKPDNQGRKTPERETSPPRFLAPPQTPPPRAVDAHGKRARPVDGYGDDDVSPNPFPEPEPSKDTYEAFIYGSVKVANAKVDAVVAGATGGRGSSGGGGGVTVLAVRKKKRAPSTATTTTATDGTRA
ncbi:hypothetical protein M0805_004741 [Coniferiporia weirii]|nr:hypothetical protein M0805_004741 [Coniferiporia weirii]